MNAADAKKLLEEKLDVYRSRYRLGLALILIVTVVAFLSYSLDLSTDDPILTTVFLLVMLVLFIPGLLLYSKSKARRGCLKRCLDDLKDQNKLEAAAEALDAPEEGLLAGQCRLAKGFLFNPDTGVVLPVEEAVWVYVQRTGSCLSLICQTATFGNTFTLLTLPKDATTADTDELLKQVQGLLPKTLIGNTEENKAAWKTIRETRWKELMAEIDKDNADA